jgi:hypothetical protein
LGTKDAIIFNGIVNEIEQLAGDKNNLFQRNLIKNQIISEYHPSSDKIEFATILIDSAFSLANAATNNAIPISFVMNQLTGRWLSCLLKKTYYKLYNLICNLTWVEVYNLSQDKEWREFILLINSFIYLVQNLSLKNQPFIIESNIKKMSSYVFKLAFWNFVKTQALDALKNKMYEFGPISEFQNFEFMLDLYTACYNGKYRFLIDAINATDSFANRLTERLEWKQFSYLLEFGNRQIAKGYKTNPFYPF